MMITKLGDDLLTEILIRLPNPRSACRSKAVCKRWNSMISDAGFGGRFLSHHQSQSQSRRKKARGTILVLSAADSLSFFLPLPGCRCCEDKLVVFDCFKDLLLCGFGEVANRHTNSELARSYLLCNPFTKRWIALPLAPETPVGNTDLCARLVCEPLLVPNANTTTSHDLLVDAAYRFRVVCIYQDINSIKLDVFCSESGEWTKEALVLEGYRRCGGMNNLVSCNELLYVSYARAQDIDAGLHKPLIAAFNPFRLDLPPSPVDVSPTFNLRFWSISVSQGVVHLSGYERLYPDMVLSVWRLEQGKFWRKVCQGPMKAPPSSSSGYKYQPTFLGPPTLHPENPEIAFFVSYGGPIGDCPYLSCDLGRGGELELVPIPTQHFFGWRVFQPKVYCWPTRIPRYRKLRAMYDGSYSCWVQRRRPRGQQQQQQQQNHPIIPSINNSLAHWH